MPTLNSAMREGTSRLVAAQIESAALDARLLLQHLLDCDHATLVRDSDVGMTQRLQAAYDAIVMRRVQREPLAHIVGRRAFWKDEFLVSADVLSPRPDSETLIETALVHKPHTQEVYHIADFGTGSGCLLSSLLREYVNALGIAVDKSDKALRIAQENFTRLGLAERVAFYHGDWAGFSGKKYDIIVCNPPYIVDNAISQLAPEVSQFEPRLALSGGVDGLDAYRTLADILPHHLATDGIAVLELGEGQANDVSALMAESGIYVLDIHNDLAGIPRAMVVTLNEVISN